MEPIDKTQDNRDRAAESLRMSRQKQRTSGERELDVRLAKTYKNLAESREYLERADNSKDAEKTVPVEKLNASNDG